MIGRHTFSFNTGASPAGDTGPGIVGAVRQIRWSRESGDTGGAIAVSLLPRTGDTGDGITILACGLTPQFQKVPVQPTHHSDGFDTGAAQEVPYVAAEDRLRVKLTPSGTGVVGRLWVWSSDDVR